MKIKLIALSGIDGSGKSTQLDLIQAHFKKKGKSVVYLWTRGGNTPGIEWLKSLGRKVMGKKLPPSGHSKKRDEMFGNFWIQRAWIIIAIIDLLRIYAFSIRWHILRGRLVICDRYLRDTLIDFKILFPQIDIENWRLWKVLVWCTPKPNLQCLLMIPESLSEKRCLEKYEPFPDTPEKRKKRYKLYNESSKMNHWLIIDSTRSVKEVFEDIINYRE